MKKIFYSLFLLSLFFSATAQETEYTNGKYDGETKDGKKHGHGRAIYYDGIFCFLRSGRKEKGD